jgi:ABC-type nitrate/sulfonate/bicarbonate transport system permease component
VARQPLAILHGARRHAAGATLAVCGLAIVALVWQVTAWASDPSQVPPPAAVWHSVISDWNRIPALSYLEFQSGGIGAAIAYSTANVIAGVGLGTAAGLPLGIMMTRMPTVGPLLETPLSLLATVPLLVVLPFITLWFGTARLAQSALVIVFSLVTVAFGAGSAAVAVSDRYAGYAASLGASRQRILWTVVLPAVGPAVLVAVRVALAAGWGWEAVSELLGARAGVGRVIEVTARLGAVSDLAATVLCIAAVALLCDAILAGAGGLLVRWRPT